MCCVLQEKIKAKVERRRSEREADHSSEDRRGSRRSGASRRSRSRDRDQDRDRVRDRDRDRERRSHRSRSRERSRRTRSRSRDRDRHRRSRSRSRERRRRSRSRSRERRRRSRSQEEKYNGLRWDGMREESIVCDVGFNALGSSSFTTAVTFIDPCRSRHRRSRS